MVAIAILVKVGMVWANAGTITEVCKTNGGLLMDRDNCPSGSEKWTIGSGGGGTTGSGVVGLDGKVVHMFDMNGQKALKKGLNENNDVVVKMYYYKEMGDDMNYLGVWVEDPELSQKMSEELFDNIFQWYGKSLITKTGEVYIYEDGMWVSKPIPAQ